METANIVKSDNRSGIPADRSSDGYVSVGEVLKNTAMIVGTTAFYAVFTEWTGIVVGNMGQVGLLRELVCPNWFLAAVYQHILAHYCDHESSVLQEVGQPDDSVSVVYACLCAQTTANRLAREYADRLVEDACAQVTAAENEVDAA